MSSVGLTAGVVALVWAYAVAWMTGVALVRRARRRRQPTSSPPGRWLLVRPCAGFEPGLFDTLTSVRAGAVEVEVVIGLSDDRDPAFDVAERACAELVRSGFDARVEIVPPAGPNRKASTLAGIVARHTGALAGIINVDSDIDMTHLDLAALLAPLSETRTGAAWMPPVEESGSTLGDRASRAVLAGSFHAFALLSALDPATLVGKVFAVRRDALEASGLDDLTHFLGEDVELSTRLRRAGFTVEPVASSACARAGTRRLSDTIGRHARWIAVVRAQRPALLLTYPLLFAPALPLLILAAIALAHSPWLALAATAAAMSARLIVSAGARRASGLHWTPWLGIVDGALAEVVLWAALTRALSSRQVEWRGRRLRVDDVGRLHAA